jgi:parvulin-like peptidyl-prolyl isomerase
MKCFLSIVAAVGVLGSFAGAQMVASHAPTAAAAPAPSSMPSASVSSDLLHATGKPVVKVNSAVLTDRDLMHELYVIFPYAQIHNGIPKDMEPEMRRGAMEMIIFDELVYQEALRRKMTIPEAKYEASQKNFMKQFPDKKAFNAFLAQECKGSPQVFRQQLTRSLLIEVLIKQEVEEKSRISDVQLRKVYDENLKKFDHPESFRFQSISIIPPPNASADVLAEARKHAEAASKAAKGAKTYEEFGLLAEKYSDDDFKVKMGEHRPTDRAELPPDVVKAALAMKPGDVSGLIPVGPNYTIFRLIEHLPAGRESFEVAKKKLREDMSKVKAEHLRKDLYTKLRHAAKVQEM